MQQFYSQHGEDYILNEIFKNKDYGFYIEVGCIDGRRFSNTLMLEEKGWDGLCIEAHNDYIDMIKKNRPNSKVIHCAIGERDDDNVIFYANSRGSLSTLDKSNEKRWKEQFSKYFTGFKEQNVKLRTLNSIIREENISEIDFISIDIEGNEYKALMGLDFSFLKPKVFLIECDTREEEQKIDSILFTYGYKKLFRISTNLFYSLIHPDFVCGYQKEFSLHHTAHHLDNTEDLTQIMKISIQENGNGIEKPLFSVTITK